MRSTSSDPSSTITWKARAKRKSPTSTLGLLPNSALALAWPRRKRAFIHHIVMQQRRGVDELDAGRERHMPLPVDGIPPSFAAAKRQQRPQPLAAGGHDMRGRVCGISATGLCILLHDQPVAGLQIVTRPAKSAPRAHPRPCWTMLRQLHSCWARRTNPRDLDLDGVPRNLATRPGPGTRRQPGKGWFDAHVLLDHHRSRPPLLPHRPAARRRLLSRGARPAISARSRAASAPSRAASRLPPMT
jgi:hypothetical protein